MKKLSYGKHFVDKKDINYVIKSFDKNNITGGRFLDEFEKNKVTVKT